MPGPYRRQVRSNSSMKHPANERCFAANRSAVAIASRVENLARSAKTASAACSASKCI